MEIFSRCDHFGTYTADSRILVWTVVADGLVRLQPGPPPEPGTFPDPGRLERK